LSPWGVLPVYGINRWEEAGKKQGGRTYYYLVESARVGGKPRIVSQRYLGSAAEIAGILAPRWVSRVITWSLTGESPAELRLRFSTDENARAALEEELFGKRILFTDKTPEAASTATIVAEYRSQEAVEGDFRQMKDTRVVSNSPMFRWRQSKIRVHIFFCVLALMVARLMVREADRAGIHRSVRQLLLTLAGIEETVLLYQGETGRPRARRMLTDIEPPAQRLYDRFGLDAYAPKR